MPSGPPLLITAPAGPTQVAAVIGDPVDHSLSPVLHNAAFAALGLDWVYVALPVPAGRAPAAVAGARVLGLRGLSVTMPHKDAVAAAVDRLTPAAERLATCNSVRFEGGRAVGDSTDGPGLVDALRVELGFDPAGRSVVVLGTGGAARAVVLALADAGGRVAVVGRRPDAVGACVALAGPAGRAGQAGDVAGADLVVNATPVGMTVAGVPFDLGPEQFGPGQLVVDLVYRPAATALLVRAAGQGAAVANGLGLLIHQAARQLRWWTGEEPPLAAMRTAAAGATEAPET
jgi:shikimate dehydrogenase